MRDQVKKHLNELIDEASRLYPLHNDLATRAYLDRIIDLARMVKAEMPAAESKREKMSEPKLLEYKPMLGREVRKQCIKYPGSMVVEYKKLGRKVVGVINRTDESLTDKGYPFEYYADVYLDDEHVFTIEECGRGFWFLKRALQGALYNIAMYATRGKRNRQNRQLKNGGAV